MPPEAIIPIAEVPLNQIVRSQEDIYRHLPHAYEFQLLHGVCWEDLSRSRMVTFHDAREDDWWVKGHIPGRPLFPGVLMLETAGQTMALLSHLVGLTDLFIGFGGVETCKFRESVQPPARLLVCAEIIDPRPRRVVGKTQGWVNGRLIFEATVIGMVMPDRKGS